jgi:hypothetical protein
MGAISSISSFFTGGAFLPFFSRSCFSFSAKISFFRYSNSSGVSSRWKNSNTFTSILMSSGIDFIFKGELLYSE